MRAAIVLVVALFALSSKTDAQHRPGQVPPNLGKVVCYYNSTSYIREGKLVERCNLHMNFLTKLP